MIVPDIEEAQLRHAQRQGQVGQLIAVESEPGQIGKTRRQRETEIAEDAKLAREALAHARQRERPWRGELDQVRTG